MSDQNPIHCDVFEKGERCQNRGERKWLEFTPGAMSGLERWLCEEHWRRAVAGEKLPR